MALYTLPLIAGAAHFWAIRKDFFFTGAGAELPVPWSVMLAIQALLGDGPYAIIRSPGLQTQLKLA